MPLTTLVSAPQLAALLAASPGQVLVCDCRFDLADPAAGRHLYAAGHIQGAVYLDLDHALSGPKTGRNGRHPLPDRDGFAALMAELGASADTQIVAYDAAESMYAARLWAMMRWLGHDAVAVLDGGLAAWTAAGQPATAELPPERPPGDLVANDPLLCVVDYVGARSASATGSHRLLDARAPDRFRGENETLDPVGGHIPGARNRFFRLNLAPDSRFKPQAELHREYLAALDGLTADAAILSCGSGVTACHDLLALEIAGLPGAALYAGSWSEWSAQPGARIQTGD